MALVLEKKVNVQGPIDVHEITPCRLSSFSFSEIARCVVAIGRREIELGELFRMSGSLSDDFTIRWQGNLENVHWIGYRQQSGKTIIETSAGRHVAHGMRGGRLYALAAVGDYAGSEFQGGKLFIDGDSGDHVGGCYRGTKQGMTGGEIFVSGNAGSGVGQGMRRGMIAVAGSVKRCCGAHMLAGSIMVFGTCGSDCGLGMKRGTIVLAGTNSPLLSLNFSLGSVYQNQVLSLLSRNIGQWQPQLSDQLSDQAFRLRHGDLLTSGRGEIFTCLDG